MTAAKPNPESTGPADAELTHMLGRSRALWDELIAGVERVHAPVTREWHFTAKTGTWHLRLKRKARTILYLLPREKTFLTAFVFGEKACAAVRAGGLPGNVVTALNEARPYAEGRGIRLTTKNRRDVATMLKLAAIKMAS